MPVERTAHAGLTDVGFEALHVGDVDVLATSDAVPFPGTRRTPCSG